MPDSDRDLILAVALKHDPDACWAWADKNCLLVSPEAVIFLLDRWPDAYVDPQPISQFFPPLEFTHVIFPEGDK